MTAKAKRSHRERNAERFGTDGPAQWLEKSGGGGRRVPALPRLDEIEAGRRSLDLPPEERS